MKIPPKLNWLVFFTSAVFILTAMKVYAGPTSEIASPSSTIQELEQQHSLKQLNNKKHKISEMQKYADQLKFNDPKDPIYVQSNSPSFVIKLQSNPTTGYSWFLKKYNSELVDLVEKEYFPPQTNKGVGAPGYDLWTFRLNKQAFLVPRIIEIKLIYARPWEIKDGTVATFTIVTK